MRLNTRRIGAFFSGLALYCAAMLMSGVMAELFGPSDFFYIFGGRDSASRILGESLLYALPVFVLALGWSYLTVRPRRRGSRPTTAACLWGMGVAWLGWLFYGIVAAAQMPHYSSLSITAMLLSSLVPPLWGMLNMVAALAGVFTAGSLARRFKPGA